MTAVWPSDVPQYALQSGFSEKPERNAVTFEPEVGPAMMRRRTSLSSDLITFQTMMTVDEYDKLLDFYRNDTKDGTQPFMRKHPRNIEGANRRFVFTAEPQLSAAGPNYGPVALALRLLP